MQEIAICSVLLKPWSTEVTAEPVLHGVYNVEPESINVVLQRTIKTYFDNLGLNYVGFSTTDVVHPAGAYFTTESSKLNSYDLMYVTQTNYRFMNNSTFWQSIGKIYVLPVDSANVLPELKQAALTYNENVVKNEMSTRALSNRLAENDLANVKLRELLSDTIYRSNAKDKQLDYFKFAIDEANETIDRLRIELSDEKTKHCVSLSMPMIKRSPALTLVPRTTSSPDLKKLNSFEIIQSKPKTNLIMELTTFDKSKLRKSTVG